MLTKIQTNVLRFNFNITKLVDKYFKNYKIYFKKKFKKVQKYFYKISKNI